MQTPLIVTRHEATTQWIRQYTGWHSAPAIAHLDMQRWRALHPPRGRAVTDVLGVLPLHLLAWLQTQGVRCWSLDLNVQASQRGSDFPLTALQRCMPRLLGYELRRTVFWPGALGAQQRQTELPFTFPTAGFPPFSESQNT